MEHVHDTHDDDVYAPSEVGADKANGAAQQEGTDHADKADGKGVAGAVETARQDIPPHIVRAEGMGQAGADSHRSIVLVCVAIGGDDVGKESQQDQNTDDDQAKDGGAVSTQAFPSLHHGGVADLFFLFAASLIFSVDGLHFRGNQFRHVRHPPLRREPPFSFCA